MRRALLLLALAVAAALPAGCGEEAVPDPRALEAEGDAYAERGAWEEAARSYGLAFALEDPVPERAAVRARVAWRRGMALARAGRGEDARLWLDRALRLDPDLYVVHYELGLLQDGHLPETVDRDTSRDELRRFLAGWERAGKPAAEASVAAEARRRLAAPEDETR